MTSNSARETMINDMKDKLLEFVLNVLPKIEVPTPSSETKQGGQESARATQRNLVRGEVLAAGHDRYRRRRGDFRRRRFSPSLSQGATLRARKRAAWLP